MYLPFFNFIRRNETAGTRAPEGPRRAWSLLYSDIGRCLVPAMAKGGISLSLCSSFFFESRVLSDYALGPKKVASGSEIKCEKIPESSCLEKELLHEERSC